ncbi:MAG: nuclear transport factor 2 family protein [Candidatus Zixiibacteriota bacterium]
MSDDSVKNNNISEIKNVIHNSIGWAKNKDKGLLYSCFANDSNLFFFNPDDSYLQGREAFENLTDNFFMKDEFKAVGYEIRDLRINLSQSETVAWWSARLDDRNEWAGRPANWINIRWTGIVEKRDGKWVIVQMHFSNALGTDNSEPAPADSATQEEDKS